MKLMNFFTIRGFMKKHTFWAWMTAVCFAVAMYTGTKKN